MISVYACHMCSVLACVIKSAHVCFRSSLTPRTLALSFLTNNSSSDSKAFYVSLRSQAPQQQYTVLSFSSMRRNGHSQKLTSLRAPRYYTVGIPFQSQASRFDGKSTISRAASCVITHYRYVYVLRRGTETLHVKKMADLVAVYVTL